MAAERGSQPPRRARSLGAGKRAATGTGMALARRRGLHTGAAPAHGLLTVLAE